MGSLSIDISVSYASGNSLNGSPEAYLERVLGRIHPDFVGDDVDPYSRRAALFRCRLCDSRHSSFGQLRTHLKRCDGTPVIDVLHKMEETSINYVPIREKPVVPVRVLTNSKTKSPISSSQISTNDERHRALTNQLCLLEEPNPEPELEPICDTNNNESFLHVDEIKVNISNSSKFDIHIVKSEKVGIVSNKKRVKPPNNKSKGKKAKICTSKTLIKPASQAVEYPVSEKFQTIFAKGNNCTENSAVERLDQKLENQTEDKKFDTTDQLGNMAGNEMEAEQVLRPKRSSKSAVSYEEQLIDFVHESSPNASPIVAKPKKMSTQESKRAPKLVLTPEKINLSLKLEVAAKVDDATIKPLVKLKREFSVSRLQSDFERDITNCITCKHCSEKVARREMIVHLRNKHSNLSFLCQACFRAFETIEEQKVHKARCKNKSVFKRLQQCRSRSTSVRRSEVGVPLTCDKCEDAEFDNSSAGRCALIRHIKLIHNAKFVCRFCFYSTLNVQLGHLHNCKGPSSFLGTEDETTKEGAISKGSSDSSVQLEFGAREMPDCREREKFAPSQPSDVRILRNVAKVEFDCVVSPKNDPEAVDEILEINHPFYQDPGAGWRTPLKEIQRCGVGDQTSFQDRVISDGSEEFDVRKLKSYKTVKDFCQFLTGDGKKLQCPLCMKELNSKQWYNYKMHLISHATKQPFKVKVSNQSPITDQGMSVDDQEDVKVSIKTEYCGSNQKLELEQEPTDVVDQKANKAVNQNMVLNTPSAKLTLDAENVATPVENSSTNPNCRRKTRSSGKAEMLEPGNFEKSEDYLDATRSSTQFSFASPEKVSRSSNERQTAGPIVSPSRGMKIDANGDIVVGSVAMSPRKLSSDGESADNGTKSDIKLKSKGAKTAKKFLPLHVDTKFKPAKESSKSGPPLNKEVMALLDQQPLSEAFNWLSNSARVSRRSNPTTSHEPIKSTADVSTKETKSLRSNPKRHSSVMSASEDPYRKNIKQDQLGNTFPCPIKGCISVVTGAEMMPHLINQHNQQSACHSCFQCFTSNHQLERHLQDVHQEAIRRPRVVNGVKQRGTNAKRQ